MAEDLGLILGQALGRGAKRVGNILLQKQVAKQREASAEAKARAKEEERVEKERIRGLEEAAKEILALKATGESSDVISRLGMLQLTANRLGLPVTPVGKQIIEGIRKYSQTLREEEAQQPEPDVFGGEMSDLGFYTPEQLRLPQFEDLDFTPAFAEFGYYGRPETAKERDKMRREMGPFVEYTATLPPEDIDEPHEMRAQAKTFLEQLKEKQTAEAIEKALAGGRLAAAKKKAQLEEEKKLGIAKKVEPTKPTESAINRQLRNISAQANRIYLGIEKVRRIQASTGIREIQDIRDIGGLLGYLESKRGRKDIKWKKGEPKPQIVKDLEVLYDKYELLAETGVGPQGTDQPLSPEEEAKLGSLREKYGIE